MLEIRKTAVSLGESDLLELERIVTDADEKEALGFLKKSIYDRVVRSQQGRLKSHLDGAGPVEGFIEHNRL
jgi:hypothetical protein